MRALITGSSGFVGPHLANELSYYGHEVFGIDANAQEDGSTTFAADVLDKARLRQVFAFVQPDVVFHLAAQSSVKKSLEQPEETLRVNIEGTRNILELADKARVVVVSSSEVYGTPEKSPVDEHAPLKPLNPYAESRVKQELLCAEFVRRGYDIVIARSFSHTGPGQSPVFVCSDFAKQVAEAEKGIRKGVQTGNLYVVRDFTDVRDVVRAYSLLAEKGKCGEIYNVCSGKPQILKEVLRQLTSFSSSKIPVETAKERVREKDTLHCVGDHTKLKNATGWQPKIPMRQTLQDLLEYWRKRV